MRAPKADPPDPNPQANGSDQCLDAAVLASASAGLGAVLRRTRLYRAVITYLVPGSQ